ncbi:MAG: hypothetical protein WCS43_02475 [Verrucomicrobiota bacterium]
MKPLESVRQRNFTAGFTLPAILIITGALLILAIGALLVTGIERNTARSFVDCERANLAARAGLENIRGILNTEAANDDFIILHSSLVNPILENRDKAPHLFLARGQPTATGYSFRYIPLFSNLTQPDPDTSLSPPKVEPLVGANDREWFEFTTLPYQDKVRAAWLPIEDDKGRTVARYAYWVEDLQGKIDPKIAGNEKGPGITHTRLAWPFPAPGLNPLTDTGAHQLDQIALYAVDPSATEDQQGTVGKKLIKNRSMLISPDSTLAAAGVPTPLARDTTGHLTAPKARAAEEALANGLQPYKEQPLVPFTYGINSSAAGKPKLNLNKLLAIGGDPAVHEMAAFIRDTLPKFDDRKGGFPDKYIETLAANALDYADADSTPTLSDSGYRGLDAYPLVSEFLMRFRWENILEENGRKYLILTASTYVELWNMTDKPATGDAEVSYETKYYFPLGANPSVSLDNMSDATPKLVENDGYRWFPAIPVSLKPNEYRVFNCGTVTYKIDAGPSSIFIPSPMVLEGEMYGTSKAGYHLKWNGKLIDQSRGGLHRNNSSLNYPKNTASQPSQRTRATIPSHSQTRGVNKYINNMGDCRMSYYNQAPQDANVYPDNYSPNRRNIRWGTIYNADVATKTKLYGRVMPSEWPDGGHNSSYESNSFYTTDERVNPDDARFFPSASSILRNPPVEEAPMRLSNIGRFYSATELGRVYDPIMWENAIPAAPNRPWGDVTSSSVSNSDFGGGNTLRIGRPEHPRFDLASVPGQEAYRLLDLFHAGIGCSSVNAEREGLVCQIEGHINLNTANRDVLRTLAVGALMMDPKISIRTSEIHNTTSLMAPPVTPFKLTPAEINIEANRIADAIILTRKSKPFTSPSSIAEILDPDGKPAFGNKDLLPDNKGSMVHLSDSAAEEIFARVYESSTVRSRNFRIWVVGQAITPTTSTTAKPEVLAEVRRVFTVFADPGERASDGSIDPHKSKLKILHENQF